MKLQYVLDGQGRPLVLVPGGLTGLISWESHAKRLSATRKVIRVQLLNVQYGIENRPFPQAYSGSTESDALAETIEELGDMENGVPMPMDIVGWSYGAFTALHYAMNHPQRIRTLTLIEPPAMWLLRTDGELHEDARRTAALLESVQGEDITEDMLDTFLNAVGFVKPGQSARALPQWNLWVPYRNSLRNTAVVVHHIDDKSRLQNITSPVLLVKGTGSAPWLHRIIDTLASCLPTSRVLEFPEGHAPHLVSKDRFLEALEQFQDEIHPQS